jgi:xanthine dehydrogenase accessory factor
LRSWIDSLAALRNARRAAVLVTIARVAGSTPREAGAKMVFGPDGAAHGTIGGGQLEKRAGEEAARLVADGSASPIFIEIPLGPEIAQCCGGHVTLLLEPFPAPRAGLLLFGAGHVGRELVEVLGGLPVPVRWIDPRAEEFPASLPANTEQCLTAAPVAEIAAAPPGSLVMVMTHSHDLDLELVEAALKRDDIPYIGLIGSRTKRARFEARLKARGIDEAALERLVCPIGAGHKTGKHPREIAISAAAELLAHGLSVAANAG